MGTTQETYYAFQEYKKKTFVVQQGQREEQFAMKTTTPPFEIVREGCSLRFWLTGPAEHPLLVFTHAAGLDHQEWENTLTVVAHEYRVLYWDVRGHGQSRPSSPPFTGSPALGVLNYATSESSD